MDERPNQKDPTKIVYSREGFPKEVVDELAILAENHDRIYGPPADLKDGSHANDPYGHNNAK